MRSTIVAPSTRLLGVLLSLLVSCSNPESPDAPRIAVAPATLAFTTSEGVNPATQTLSLANSGAGELVWSASDDADWLTVTPANGVGGATLSATVDVAGIEAGTLNATVTVAADEASNSPRTVGVTLTVTESPATIGVAPTSLAFTGSAGGANPASKTLDITNEESGDMAWTATDDASWLTLSAASGTAPSTVTVSVNTAGLAAGTHSATITIASEDASNSPRTVEVTLTLAADYSGTWTGTTSQDSTIALDIASNALEKIEFGFRIPTCGVSGRTTTTFNTPPNISSGSFSQSVGAPPLTYTVTGSFSSPNMVSGTLVLQWSNSGCSATVNATWSAARASPAI